MKYKNELCWNEQIYCRWQTLFPTNSKFNPLRLTVAILGTAIKHPVPDRVKPSFVIFHVRALWRSGLSVRVPGCQNLKSLECKGYSALRSAVMTEFLDIGWRKNSIIRLLAKWKFGTVDRHPSSDRRTAHRLLMKTSTQLSHCCWVRKTNRRATEQSREISREAGDPLIISFADYSLSASQLPQEKARSTADWSARHARVIFGMQFERR